MANDNTFTLQLEKFGAGYSPLAFSDALTQEGGGGHASVMTNVDVLDGKLTQGPALSNLSGSVTELIQFIMDKAVTDNVSYAIGTANLFQISSTAVSGIHAISGCTEGESIQVLKGSLYYFFNTASEGRIGRYNTFTTFSDSWATGLQLAPHPSDKKEDIMVFGNGRYAGVYIQGSDDLDIDKLDFGNDVEVADVLYSNGYWYIAVNAGVTGTNRAEGQIYLYDGAALINTLDDEAGVGMMRIGFLYRIGGVIYVAYQDLSSSGFIIGYLNGKTIVPLQRFTGNLPTFAQKTLYKNTILFLSSGLVYSAGAFVPELPFQLSQHADAGYSTVGAIAAPFGTPILSSTDGVSYRLAKFSGYDTNCTWKSIVFPLSEGRMLGYIDNITVLTNSLGSGASCSLTLECNQNTSTSSAKTITTAAKQQHIFTSFGLNGVGDLRVALDFSGGSASNNVVIRSITLQGHWVEN